MVSKSLCCISVRGCGQAAVCGWVETVLLCFLNHVNADAECVWTAEEMQVFASTEIQTHIADKDALRLVPRG